MNHWANVFFIVGIILIFARRFYINAVFPALCAWAVIFLLYYFFEANAIDTNHDYYLFPFIPMLYLIIFYGLYHLVKRRNAFLILASLVLCILMPFTAKNSTSTLWDLNPDDPIMDFVTNHNDLRHAVKDDALIIVGNDYSPFIELYYLHKKGWVYNSDELSDQSIHDFICWGAQYLYSNSRNFDNKPQIKKHLGKIIMQRNSVIVYQLVK